MMDSMIYTQINQKMDSLLPTLKNALLGKGKLTQEDSNFMMAVLRSKDPKMESLKSQLLQNVANIEASTHIRGTSSSADGGIEIANTTYIGAGADGGAKGGQDGNKNTNKDKGKGWTRAGDQLDIKIKGGLNTKSNTAHNVFVPKYLEQLNKIDFKTIKNGQDFINKANKIAEEVTGNPIMNVLNPDHNKPIENPAFKKLDNSFKGV